MFRYDQYKNKQLNNFKTCLKINLFELNKFTLTSFFWSSSWLKAFLGGSLKTSFLHRFFFFKRFFFFLYILVKFATFRWLCFIFIIIRVVLRFFFFNHRFLQNYLLNYNWHVNLMLFITYQESNFNKTKFRIRKKIYTFTQIILS